MPVIKLTTESSRSEAMLHAQRWMHKMVRYAEGRTGKVVDLSLDGKRLCIRRETVRGRDSERDIIWVDTKDVEIVDVRKM